MSMTYERAVQHRSVRLYGGNRKARVDARNDMPDRISFSVQESSAAEEWYGRGAMGVLGLGFAGGGLHQPITDRFHTGVVPAFSKKGIRQNIGRILLAVFAVILVVAVMGGINRMVELSSRNAGTERDIRNAVDAKVQLEQQIRSKADAINIGYEAAQMGMVSTQSTDIIALTVPVYYSYTADGNGFQGQRIASAN